MARYTDVNNVISVLEILAEKCADDKAFEQTISVLKDAPIADVVEVVRCTDCIYSLDIRACNLPYGENGYCPLGKRREDVESNS